MSDKYEAIVTAEQIRAATADLLAGMEFEDWRKEVTPGSLPNDVHAALLASGLPAEIARLRAEVEALRRNQPMRGEHIPNVTQSPNRFTANERSAKDRSHD